MSRQLCETQSEEDIGGIKEEMQLHRQMAFLGFVALPRPNTSVTAVRLPNIEKLSPKQPMGLFLQAQPHIPFSQPKTPSPYDE